VALDEAVDRSGEQFGTRMSLSIPLRVAVGVLQTKVRTKVDHLDSSFEQSGHEVLTLSVWKCEEDDVDLLTQYTRGWREDELWIDAGESGEHFANSPTGTGLSRREHHVEVRMRRGEAKYLGTGVSRRSDYSNSHDAILCTQVLYYANYILVTG
jgi:hypothetical protein